MITQRGFTVVFAGALFLTSGFSFMNFYLTLLGVYLFVGLVVTLPLFALTANLSGIEVDRQIDKTKVFSGDFLRVRVTIRNASRRHFDFIEVWDQYPETWILAIGENFMAFSHRARQQHHLFLYSPSQDAGTLLPWPYRGRNEGQTGSSLLQARCQSED